MYTYKCTLIVLLSFNVRFQRHRWSYNFFFSFFFFSSMENWGAWWLSGRVSDPGARGRGFETYRRHVVSLSKTLYSPKVLVNYPGSGGSIPTWLKIVDWDVKPQHKNQWKTGFKILDPLFSTCFLHFTSIHTCRKLRMPTLCTSV